MRRRDEKHLEPSSSSEVDIFALGVLLYFILYRTLPFYAPSAEEMLLKTRQCQVALFALKS